MTWALCLNCGATKWGAICACSACQVKSTGDIHLDIAFSDHQMSKETLEAFGEVVRAIHRVCDDGHLCFWAFTYYIAKHHPDILEVEFPPERQTQCEEVLLRANPPTVEVIESEEAKYLREQAEKNQA